MQDRKTSTLQHHRMLEGELGRLSLHFLSAGNGEDLAEVADFFDNITLVRAQQARLQRG